MNQPKNIRFDQMGRMDTLRAADLPTQKFLDCVVMAAASLAGVPMSAVTIVGSAQVEVKAGCGLPISSARREHSFCTHVVLNAEPLVVSEAKTDPRFSENPYVIGPPYIRFYAGFPLKIEGEIVGALCVVDDRTRVLSSEQLQRLAVLASGVAAMLSIELLEHRADQAV